MTALKYIQMSVLYFSKKGRKVTAQKEALEPFIFDCQREYPCLLIQDEERKKDGLFLRWKGQRLRKGCRA